MTTGEKPNAADAANTPDTLDAALAMGQETIRRQLGSRDALLARETPDALAAFELVALAMKGALATVDTGDLGDDWRAAYVRARVTREAALLVANAEHRADAARRFACEHLTSAAVTERARRQRVETVMRQRAAEQALRERQQAALARKQGGNA